ncbi:MAG TPA: ketose-bisphosphate aldolase [Anaerolineae bacterium]|nr:ketose-bisphosphate aldolase [Anaerolineae bacterium]
MPLVTSKEILQRALADRFAVGAFNANNMEMVQAIIGAAQEERAPVILQVSQGAIRYAGLEYAAGLVKIAASMADIPVVLHLDHGTSFEQNVRCLRAGFTSLMFDGSKLPYEENVAITKKVCEIAHLVGIPVEAELGRVLKATEGVTPEEVRAAMTDPDQAKEFIELTGADSLAVAVGSVHAMRAREAELDIDRIEAIRQKTGVPLVLHGSSGVKHESILEAIEHGICKINVATYLNQAFVRGMREGLEKMPDEVDPRKFLAISRENVKEAVREKIRLFGASGRIDSSGGFVSPPRQFPSVELGGSEE